MNFKHHTHGFTILLAALIGSLVLSIGVSIFSIAQKQLVLSSIGKSSGYAFYAADTSAECALYWDLRHDFASSTGPLSTISCDSDTAIAVTHSSLVTYPITYSFTFEPSGYCAQVVVTKNTVNPRTRIHADGFSTACADIETSARSLQRSVELTY